MPEMTFKQALDLAARHAAAGELAQAESIYRQVLALYPNAAPVLHLLGVLRARSGDHVQAEELISRAIAADPTRPEYRANLGNVLQEGGRVEQAIDAYRNALALAPQHPEILNNLGNALQKAGNLAAAIEAFRNALEIRTDFVQARFNLANALTNAGDPAAAVEAYRETLRIAPDYFEAWLNLAIACAKAGDAAGDVEAGERAVALRPASAEARKNLGQALSKLGRYREAVESLRTAQALDPRSAEIAQDLGNTLRETGRIDEAIDAYRRSIELRRDSADAHYGLSWALLMKGQFPEGFSEYEWRHRLAEATGKLPAVDVPWWRGTSLNGKSILLHAEQGFGDTLFAMRYVPRIAAMGANVVVRAPGPLVRLLRNQLDGCQVIGNNSAVPRVDLQAMMMSLPRAFVSRVEDIAENAHAYVFPDRLLAAAWKERLDRDRPQVRKKVGLVWAGGPTPRGRSIPFPQFSELLQVPGIEFHSLQKGDRAADARGSEVSDWDPQLADFADTAGLIANLDLVITIDSAVAHLAGAMGTPVWVMLRHAADWRWFLNRGDSPWYPSMRLFRQKYPGDWSAVLDDVRQALAAVGDGPRAGTIP